jgi:hypothetical protein
MLEGGLIKFDILFHAPFHPIPQISPSGALPDDLVQSSLTARAAQPDSGS